MFIKCAAHIKFTVIIALSLCLTSFYFLPSSYAQDAKSFPIGDFAALKKTDSVQVLEVLSPLTLKLSNGDIIRLTGLRYTDYTVDQAGPFGVVAHKILKDLLEDEDVEIYQTREKDWGRTSRMGQKLAHIVRKRDGAWAQGAIISLGLAQTFTSGRNPEMAEQLYALEESARKEKLGLWSEDIIRTPETVSDHINSVQIVEGTIKSAAMNKNRVYLNFGGNWRDDFTISIAPENRKAFTKDALNPLEWGGKTVRVRGWVEDYNGPHIEIDHPEAIQLLTR